MSSIFCPFFVCVGGLEARYDNSPLADPTGVFPVFMGFEGRRVWNFFVSKWRLLLTNSNKMNEYNREFERRHGYLESDVQEEFIMSMLEANATNPEVGNREKNIFKRFVLFSITLRFLHTTSNYDASRGITAPQRPRPRIQSRPNLGGAGGLSHGDRVAAVIGASGTRRNATTRRYVYFGFVEAVEGARVSVRINVLGNEAYFVGSQGPMVTTHAQLEDVYQCDFASTNDDGVPPPRLPERQGRIPFRMTRHDRADPAQLGFLPTRLEALQIIQYADAKPPPPRGNAARAPTGCRSIGLELHTYLRAMRDESDGGCA
jgi:hypothetical protein